MKYTKIYSLFLLLSLSFISCNQSDSSEEKMEKLILQGVLIETNPIYSDCVYCTNPQNYQGTCTCYHNVKIGSCPGVSSGELKSNSYRVSCSELESKGKWEKIDSESSSCTYLTCPPEAYQSAFGKEDF